MNSFWSTCGGHHLPNAVTLFTLTLVACSMPLGTLLAHIAKQRGDNVPVSPALPQRTLSIFVSMYFPYPY